MGYTLRRGDPVWYRPRLPTDYGFDGEIPAIFLAAYSTRTSIRLLLKDGTEKHVAVLPRRVRPRDGLREIIVDHLARSRRFAARLEELRATDPAAAEAIEQFIDNVLDKRHPKSP